MATYSCVLVLDALDVGFVDLSRLLLKPQQYKDVLDQVYWEIVYQRS
jgi:hypothetical protein